MWLGIDGLRAQPDFSEIEKRIQSILFVEDYHQLAQS